MSSDLLLILVPTGTLGSEPIPSCYDCAWPAEVTALPLQPHPGQECSSFLSGGRACVPLSSTMPAHPLQVTDGCSCPHSFLPRGQCPSRGLHLTFANYLACNLSRKPHGHQAGGQGTDPTGNAPVGLTHLVCLPQHSIQPSCRPDGSHAHSTHGGGAQALETAQPRTLGLLWVPIPPTRLSFTWAN